MERNAKEVRYGTVGVELRIHDGRIVNTVYKTSITEVKRGEARKNEEEGIDG